MGWRRIVRRIAAWSVGPPLVLVAGVLGTMLALLYSPPGRRLTARLVTDFISGRVAGRVEIGAIRGNIVRHLVLERVTITDSTGATFLTAPRVEVRYLLSDGTVLTKAYTVAPESRRTIYVDDEDFGQAGRALANASVSCAIHSGTPTSPTPNCMPKIALRAVRPR